MANPQAVIALGSNLGDSSATIAAAASSVSELLGIELLALSSTYTSEPALVTNQPNFKNAVMLVETSLAPLELLRALQSIEAAYGRVREGAVPKGPRTLDLDIIDIEGVVSDAPELTLPHPEALYRDFVVTPLLEISPFHVLANGKVVNSNAVTCGDIVEEFDENLASELSQAEGDSSQEFSENPPSELPQGQEDGFKELSTYGADGAARFIKETQGRLFVCATPIGNMGDITLRVLEALQAADSIYCEDTRVTRRITSRYGISTPLKRGDSHKLFQLIPTICAELEEGRCLAYVTDAGMPGISDPGGQLVAAVREAGYPVEVLPGASALTTALASSGIKAHNHYFGGFFPRKSGAGKRLLEELLDLDNTALVFYESVHRTAKTLQLIAEVLPARRVVMARELTKLHEEILSDTAEALATTIATRIANGRPLKGEVVLIIAPSDN